MTVVAAVDIGTNSTRLLVVDGEETLAAESRGTRLGTGLQHSGRLDPAARERTLAAITDYMTAVREHGASIACIATSNAALSSIVVNPILAVSLTRIIVFFLEWSPLLRGLRGWGSRSRNRTTGGRLVVRSRNLALQALGGDVVSC